MVQSFRSSCRCIDSLSDYVHAKKSGWQSKCRANCDRFGNVDHRGTNVHLTFYMLVALASEKAIANKWYEWPLHLCLVGCCCIFASGCAWYDTDFTTEVNGVRLANRFTIMAVVVLYAVICLLVSPK
jgi:hypothetical protein